MVSQRYSNQIQLRDYQQSLVQGIYEQWRRSPKVMAQLPTGRGKTVIFSAIAHEFVSRGEKVLVLAHREELITQAASKLEVVTVAGDFSAAGLAKANNVVKLSGDLVKAYRHHCPAMPATSPTNLVTVSPFSHSAAGIRQIDGYRF